MIYWVTALFSLLGMFFGVYFIGIGIIGNLKKRRTIPGARPQKRFAVLIAARNEACVIGGLVDSLLDQNYPRRLYDVYVMPNNCTDDTEAVARAHGAKIFPILTKVKSKGEVLNEAINALAKGNEYDAFIIIDADNLVDSEYLRAANDALCAGYQVAQGYRDSKNPDDGWVAGCTSVFFWFMNRLYNQARFNLNLSVSLNGTGIMVSSALIREMGWSTHTLTEDLEFTAQCALRGVKIGWMRDAILYDEQPLKLRESVAQRHRWTAGSVQNFKIYFTRLFSRAIRKHHFGCLDMALIFSGPIIQLVSVVPFILMLMPLVREILLHPAEGVLEALLTLGVMALGFVIVAALAALVVCLLEGKMNRRRLPALAMMWAFLAMWFFINLASLFTRAPKWTTIAHGQDGAGTVPQSSLRTRGKRKRQASAL